MSLGSSIVKARKDASFSIDELSQATSIRLTLLREIEADDFSHCGGDTYARGHVRNIARALKVDENEFLRLYDLEQRVEERSIQALLVENSVMRQPQVSRRVSWKVLIGISIGSLATVGIAQIIISNNSASPINKPIVGISASPTPSASTSPSATATPLVKPSPSPTTSKSATAKPRSSYSTGTGVEVIVNVVRAKTWLFVSDASGRTLFSGEVPVGESAIYTTTTRLDLKVGNAGGVDLQVNGKKRGEVTVARDAPNSEIEAAVLALDTVKQALDGKPVRKLIIVPQRIVNVVG